MCAHRKMCTDTFVTRMILTPLCPWCHEAWACPPLWPCSAACVLVAFNNITPCAASASCSAPRSTSGSLLMGCFRFLSKNRACAQCVAFGQRS